MRISESLDMKQGDCTPSAPYCCIPKTWFRKASFFCGLQITTPLLGKLPSSVYPGATSQLVPPPSHYQSLTRAHPPSRLHLLVCKTGLWTAPSSDISVWIRGGGWRKRGVRVRECGLWCCSLQCESCCAAVCGTLSRLLDSLCLGFSSLK